MPATAKRPTTVENITVLQIGEYGVRVGEKLWFGVNEPLTPQHFVPNQGYKVAVVVSKTGKKYISEIIGTEVAQPAPAAAAPAPAPTPAPVPAPASQAAPTHGRPTRAGYDKPLTDYDLAKDRQISRAGLYQAALNSPALSTWATNPDEYLALVRKAADAGVQYVSE